LIASSEQKTIKKLRWWIRFLQLDRDFSGYKLIASLLIITTIYGFSQNRSQPKENQLTKCAFFECSSANELILFKADSTYDYLHSGDTSYIQRGVYKIINDSLEIYEGSYLHPRMIDSMLVFNPSTKMSLPIKYVVTRLNFDNSKQIESFSIDKKIFKRRNCDLHYLYSYFKLLGE
jgi:hypothetical protein